jgi:hypothetical protein
MIEYTVEVYPSGCKYWLLNGQCHRTDGPAVEQTSGDKQQWWYLEWWLDGKQITKQEHQAAMNPVEEMTMEEICKALGKTVKVKKWWNIL